MIARTILCVFFLLAARNELVGAPQVAFSMKTLHQFARTNDPQQLVTGLVFSEDGMLYGTTDSQAFLLSADGSQFHVLTNLNTAVSGAGLKFEGRNGLLYGLCKPSNSVAALYTMGKDGTGLAFPRRYSTTSVVPFVLFEGSDGWLFGIAPAGIVKIASNGVSQTTLRTFPSSDDFPSSLIEGSDGALYGTSEFGGASDGGMVFRLNKDGSGYRVIKSFNAFIDNVAQPNGLLEAKDGRLYGSGGRFGFSIGKDGSGFRRFPSSLAGLVEGIDGMFYTAEPQDGSTRIARVNRDGTGQRVLWSLPSSTGTYLGAPRLVVGRGAQANRLYCYDSHYRQDLRVGGVIRVLNTDGSDSHVLKGFGIAPEGEVPDKLLRARTGLIYGLAGSGGPHEGGVLFRMNPDGTDFALIKGFPDGPTDGSKPACLVEGNNETLYGMTARGGANGYGTVFRLNADGTGYGTLLSFGYNAGLAGNQGALVVAEDGKLYGAANDSIFSLAKDGTGYTVLRVFRDGAERGAQPVVLIDGHDGFLYGTTEKYATSMKEGTVFRIGKDGAGYQVLWSLPFRATNPGLLLLGARDGALLGASTSSGAYGAPGSQLFRVNRDGSERSVLPFVDGRPVWTAAQAEEGGFLLGLGDGSILALSEDGSQTTSLPGPGSSVTSMTGSASGAFFGTAGTRVFSLTTRPNSAPEMSNPIPEQRLELGDTWGFTVPSNSFRDSDPEDADTLRITASGLPEQVRFDGATATFSGTPTNAGTYRILLRAVDGGLPSLPAESSFSLVVSRSWEKVADGLGRRIMALTVLGDDLYAAGLFTNAGPVRLDYIARWDGTAWAPVGGGLNGYAYALAVMGRSVFVGGDLWRAGTVDAQCIAEWDGAEWKRLGAGLAGTVQALAVSGTNLYAGGSFTSSGKVSAAGVARWDGLSWSALGSGVGFQVKALAVAGGVVYAGGRNSLPGGATSQVVAKWDGARWAQLGSGVLGHVKALALAGSDLYAGGEMTLNNDPTQTCKLARWDGRIWTAVPYPVIGYLECLASSGNDLYVGGNLGHVLRWDGERWTSLGSKGREFVSALVATETELYAANLPSSSRGTPGVERATIGAPQPAAPRLGGIVWLGTEVQIRWDGTHALQWSVSPSGPWQDLPQAASPFVVAAEGIARFFRLKGGSAAAPVVP